MGTKLLMSTSFHLQMDGATERANRSIGQILQALVQPDQKDWVAKCPWVEFAINLSISSATKLAPFEITGGFVPTIMTTVKVTENTLPGVLAFAQGALRNMCVAHDTLIEAQVFQKHHADKRQRQEPVISEDDLVYLSMKNLNMLKDRASKLMPKYIGPYRVLKAIPSRSNYVLELPPELAKHWLHPKFHIGRL